MINLLLTFCFIIEEEFFYAIIKWVPSEYAFKSSSLPTVRNYHKYIRLPQLRYTTD